MRYVPYQNLGDTPNIIVDGAPQQATRVTLSHWPHSGTSWELKADLSAQIVFRYLERPDLHVAVDAVSNNHFDEDGLMSLYSILSPEQSKGRQGLLVDVAAAGDFGTYRYRDAVRVAFVIAAFSHSGTSPLPRSIFDLSYSEVTGELYQEMLSRLPDLLANVEAYRKYWEQEDQELSRSEAAIYNGAVRIEDYPEIDLAIVTLQEGTNCHPIAIHNATDRFRILIIAGAKYEFKYRYETWVQYISSRPLPRVDLTPLAAQLSQQESAGWKFDGVDQIVPRLYLEDKEESRISPDTFRRQMIDFLARAPYAWDPFDPRR